MLTDLAREGLQIVGRYLGEYPREDKECIQKMKEEADALSASVASLLEDIDALESK
jgi:hypothetical protein